MDTLISIFQRVYDQTMNEQEALELLLNKQYQQALTPTQIEGNRPEYLEEKDPKRYVEQFVMYLLQKRLSLKKDQFDETTHFAELGLDSISVIEIMNTLKGQFQLSIPPTLLLEHRNAQAFATHLASTYSSEIKAVMERKTPAPLSSPENQPLPEKPQGPSQSRETMLDDLNALWDEAEDQIINEKENDLEQLWEQAEKKAEPSLLLPYTIGKEALAMECFREGRGKPVLFISGLMSAASMWSQQVETFRSQYELILLHPPGHGRSMLPSAKVGFAEIADGIHQVLKGLGITAPIPIVGWSLGGVLALQFGLKHPDSVQSIIAINTPPHSVKGKTDLLSLSQEENLARFSHDLFLDEIQDGLLDYYQEQLQSYDIKQALKTFSKPVYVIYGTKDAYIKPEYSKKLAALIPKAASSAIQDAGHFLPATHAESLNQLIGEYL